MSDSQRKKCETRLRDRVTFKISVRFKLVKVRVSYVILRKNDRRTKAEP